MGTTLLNVNTGLRDAVADILKEVLDCRESLPKAANNRPPYPSDAFARYAHVELVNDRGPTFKGLEHLMSITLCNVNDRMPPSEAKRWLRRAERYVDAQIVAVHERTVPTVLPITSALRREQRANHAFDMDEFRVLERMDCPDVVRTALASCRDQRRATEAAEVALEHHLTTLTTRHGGLEMMR